MRTYTIGTTARLTDLNAATIRNWQKRYGIVVPQRDAHGRRRFSREQVEHLRLLKRWRDAGLSAAEAHEHLRSQLQTAIDPAPAAPSSERLDEIIAAGVRARRDARELCAHAFWLRSFRLPPART